MVAALKRTSGIAAEYILATLTSVDAVEASLQALAKGLLYVYVSGALIEAEVEREKN